jgi:hypothetical protein
MLFNTRRLNPWSCPDAQMSNIIELSPVINNIDITKIKPPYKHSIQGTARARHFLMQWHAALLCIREGTTRQ